MLEETLAPQVLAFRQCRAHAGRACQHQRKQVRIESIARTCHRQCAEDAFIDRVAHDARRAGPALVRAAVVLGAVHVQRTAEIE